MFILIETNVKTPQVVWRFL